MQRKKLASAVSLLSKGVFPGVKARCVFVAFLAALLLLPVGMGNTAAAEEEVKIGVIFPLREPGLHGPVAPNRSRAGCGDSQ